MFVNSHDPRPAQNSTTLRGVEFCAGTGSSLRVVEFCAGSGHVAFPLLWVVLSHLHLSQKRGVSFDLEFTILDMNADALRTAKARIDKLTEPLLEHFQLSRRVAGEVDARTSDTNLVCEEVPGLAAGGSKGTTELDTTSSRRPGPTTLASAAPLSTEGSGGSPDFIADFFGPPLKRLRIRLLHCMVSDFNERAAEFSDGAVDTDAAASSLLKPIRSRIDVGIALHACGRASDEVMSLCAEKQASFVVAPCCVGRLAQTVGAGRGGGGEGEEHVVSRFRDKKWDSVLTCTFPRSRRLRECLSFQDYCVVAKAADWASHQGEEAENPDLRMVKMYPATCTPKNDILLASYAAR
eukprot:g7444.t1